MVALEARGSRAVVRWRLCRGLFAVVGFLLLYGKFLNGVSNYSGIFIGVMRIAVSGKGTTSLNIAISGTTATV